ncbi:hypothetical protein EJ04DRAFT_596205 [Polyplosphaeria fusca]|uniref:Uncharacterized protein n=1 Tax=Polyplosphaeria fusca TaxID=682080 RepID=A0A9P4QKB5_9PLEO|nr:hypothetical protein EJ04DRAFT_596205 [Polyplosphaeria fusca]
MMFLSIALLALVGSTAAAPVDAIAQGSKHTVYLMTCTRSGLLDCPLLILCDKNSTAAPNSAAASRFTAVAYFANGPPSGIRSSPTSLTTVSQGIQPWEGTQRVATINREGFSSNIDAGAGALPKGQIAGNAKLGNEDFVCFTDGSLRISGEEDLGLTTWSCTASYYCPSVAV